MPTYTDDTRRASRAQLDYIADLRRQLGLPALTPLARSGLTGGRNGTASAMISQLTSLRANTPADRLEVQSFDERQTGTQLSYLPFPSDSTRTGRMLLAGQVTATVTLPSGEHVTLHARGLRRVNGRWQRTSGHLAEPDAGMRVTAGRRGRRIGWISLRHSIGNVGVAESIGYRIAWDEGITEEVKRAVRALFQEAANHPEEGWEEQDGFRFQVADLCGRCGRTLTDPVSIDRGIGPDCYGQMTGSHHAQIETSRERPGGMLAEIGDGSESGAMLAGMATRPVPLLQDTVLYPSASSNLSNSHATVSAEYEDEADEQAAIEAAGEHPIDAEAASARLRIRAAFAHQLSTLTTHGHQVEAPELEAAQQAALATFDRLVEGCSWNWLATRHQRVSKSPLSSSYRSSWSAQ